MTRPVAPETSSRSCLSIAQLPPANGSARATTFQAPFRRTRSTARAGARRAPRASAAARRPDAPRPRAGGVRLGREAQVLRHSGCRHGAAVAPGQRHLAHEAVGGAVEELLVLDDTLSILPMERPGDAHRASSAMVLGCAEPSCRTTRPWFSPDWAIMGDHYASPALAAELQSPWQSRAHAPRRPQLVFHQAVDGPGGNRPSELRSPALTPSGISMPSSMVATG